MRRDLQSMEFFLLSWKARVGEIPSASARGCYAHLKSTMNNTDFSSLSRPIHPMPEYVKTALVDRGLLDAYHSRPPYQQNDYIGWINRAKRIETKMKRLNQMLDELEQGDVYMKMDYTPGSSRK
jgi:hypothetical protein